MVLAALVVAGDGERVCSQVVTVSENFTQFLDPITSDITLLLLEII